MNTRCGLSDREFQDCFDSIEDCVFAAFEDGVQRVSRIVAVAVECEDAWPERVRAGLSALLAFLDEEPGWARFLSTDPPVATAAVLEHRQQALRSVAQVLMDETRTGASSAGWFVPPCELTAELIVGGVFSVIRARMLEDRAASFVELEPSLLAFILAPYQALDGRRSADDGDARESRAARRPIRATYRTTRVLSAIGDSPGLSNREIAEAAGLADEGQMSKLLRRLEQRGLVQNVGLGQSHGGSNAWLLTSYGEQVRDATRHSLVPGAGAVMGSRVRGAAA